MQTALSGTLRMDIAAYLRGRVSGCALTSAILKYLGLDSKSGHTVYKVLSRMVGHELSTGSARGINCLDGWEYPTEVDTMPDYNLIHVE